MFGKKVIANFMKIKNYKIKIAIKINKFQQIFKIKILPRIYSSYWLYKNLSNVNNKQVTFDFAKFNICCYLLI